MYLSKTGVCSTCMKEARLGKPVDKERPIFFRTCPFDVKDGYSKNCQYHYVFSGEGEPSNFFKIHKNTAKDVCDVLYERGTISMKDIKILAEAIQLI